MAILLRRWPQPTCHLCAARQCKTMLPNPTYPLPHLLPPQFGNPFMARRSYLPTEVRLPAGHVSHVPGIRSRLGWDVVGGMARPLPAHRSALVRGECTLLLPIPAGQPRPALAWPVDAHSWPCTAALQMHAPPLPLLQVHWGHQFAQIVMKPDGEDNSYHIDLNKWVMVGYRSTRVARRLCHLLHTGYA